MADLERLLKTAGLLSGQVGSLSPEFGRFMRISDRYIARQVLAGTFYAVMVLSVALVLGRLFKEIQPLLVEQKAPLVLVLRFVLNVLPLSLMYTLPWGFLSAVLLVFGRLSAGQEITAFRVAGISLVRLSAPVFLIGALLSLASLWINVNVVPKSKASSVQLIYDQAARDPDSLLKPGVVQGNFKGKGGGIQKVLIEDRSAEWVEGFHYHQQANGADADRTYVHAARAALAIDAEKNQLRVKLEDAFFMTYRADGKDEMAFAGEAEPLLIDLNDSRSKKLRPSEMTNLEIQQRLANATDLDDKQRLKLKSEVTKRYSFSMACLAFAFIAVPLGLNSRRRETSGGLVLSLLIGTAYFLVTVLAKQFDSEAVTSAVLWAPNMACVLLGLIFFRRARFR